MVKIIPAILTNDPNEAREMLSRVEKARVDRVQIDIIDGVFAHNKTIDPAVFEGVETDVDLDFHLMVKEPIGWIERCVRAGADRIIGQVEMMNDQKEFMGKVQEVGAKAGLAIDLKTDVDSLDLVVLGDIDALLIMSVEAGLGGQKFDNVAFEKIKKLDEIRSRNKTNFKIIDDGGITMEIVDNVQEAGVDEVVVGRRIFDGDVETNIRTFLKAAYERSDER